jgi:hypothetical protein
MAKDVEHPDIRYVVPPTRLDGTTTGQSPRMRHDPDCSHFIMRTGETLGDPVLASPEQMATLPACKTCVERHGNGTGSRVERGGVHGDPCPGCQMALPLTGVCDDCG